MERTSVCLVEDPNLSEVFGLFTKSVGVDEARLMNDASSLLGLVLP